MAGAVELMNSRLSGCARTASRSRGWVRARGGRGAPHVIWLATKAGPDAREPRSDPDSR